MKLFAALIKNLDQTNATNQKVELLAQYFEHESNEKNKIWAIAIFTGKKPPRIVNAGLLRKWSAELAGIPLWLFEQNYHIVGDLAETISLILPTHENQIDIELSQLITEMYAVKNEAEDFKKKYILEIWQSMDKDQLWIFNKLITGGFRIGVSKNIIIQALSKVTGFGTNHISFLLIGGWHPDTISWAYFTDQNEGNSDISKPYPFFLAHPITEADFEKLDINDWLAEWKWDGIRGQLIKRKDHLFLWSRGEELITDKFPELVSIMDLSGDFVMDGEILAWKDDHPMDFQFLQTRIGRKNPSKKILSEVPVRFIAYDLLEKNGKDLRHLTFSGRRNKLEEILNNFSSNFIGLSPLIGFEDKQVLYNLRNLALAHHAEGIMLKRKSGIYHSGRKTGDLWKWKRDPFTIDAVMIYAQRGHGRRANLFSDFTFALRDGDQLLPFAKAYSGLTDVEMKEITAFVKKNTLQSFGPVNSVKAELVFELAFEGISLSTRHKSGIAVRFPRINRWRKDKSADQIDTIENIKKLLKK